jgi:hypothetical protein
MNHDTENVDHALFWITADAGLVAALVNSYN